MSINLKEYFELLYNALLKEYPALFIQNSIEAESLHKACELASLGQTDIAYQIIEHLLIPADIQQGIIARMQNSSSVAATRIPTSANTSISLNLNREKVQGESELKQKEVDEQETKTFLEKSNYEVVMDNNIVTEIPIPHPPVVTTAIPMPSPPPVFLNKVTTAPPLPVIPLTSVSEKEMAVDVVDTSLISPISLSASAPTYITKEEEQKELLQHILINQKVIPDSESHTRRFSENKNTLEEIIKQRQSNKKEDNVLGQSTSTVTSSQYDIPGIIKTYAEPAPSSAQTAQQELLIQKKIEKAKYMFMRVEEYLIKAYASGEETLILSAERQYKNLKQRYPEYSEHAKDHIQKLDMLKVNFTHQKNIQQEQVKEKEQEQESLKHSQSIIEKQETSEIHTELKMSSQAIESASELVVLNNIVLANTQIQLGMKITGEEDIYKVIRIEKHGEYVRVVFEGEQSHVMYNVPAPDLENALYIEDLHPDTFFAPFIARG